MKIDSVTFNINTEGLSLFVKALAVQARIEGMKAENLQRAHFGDSMAYTFADFYNVGEELEGMAMKMEMAWERAKARSEMEVEE